MTFVSFEYLLLLLSVFAAYYLLPWRPRPVPARRQLRVLRVLGAPEYAYVIASRR
jgi:hypothetical protein